MKRDSRLSSMLHLLIHMAQAGQPLTSEALARMLKTNPVLVRRTLAGLRGRVQAVGVGYASARLATIFPQWHDLPMDLLVTEEGVSHRTGA